MGNAIGTQQVVKRMVQGGKGVMALLFNIFYILIIFPTCHFRLIPILTSGFWLLDSLF